MLTQILQEWVLVLVFKKKKSGVGGRRAGGRGGMESADLHQTVAAQPLGPGFDWKHSHWLWLGVGFHLPPQGWSQNKTNPFPQLVTILQEGELYRRMLYISLSCGRSRSARRPQPHVIVGKLQCRSLVGVYFFLFVCYIVLSVFTITSNSTHTGSCLLWKRVHLKTRTDITLMHQALVVCNNENKDSA